MTISVLCQSDNPVDNFDKEQVDSMLLYLYNKHPFVVSRKLSIDWVYTKKGVSPDIETRIKLRLYNSIRDKTSIVTLAENENSY